MTEAALLALEDGSLFHGASVGAPGEAVGEVVFNTAMTGYQEILSDPSYCRQIVTLTYPHIGNVGTNPLDDEAPRVHASGLVVRDVPRRYSNFRGEADLSGYLRDREVVAIADIDTRRLTRILRDRGAQRGCVMAGAGVDPERAVAAARGFPGLGGMDLAQVVSTGAPYDWRGGVWELTGNRHREAPASRFDVVAYDFGVKRNILRLLTDRGCRVHVVPARTDAASVLARRPDGVFLSNGPGDPEPCDYAIEAVRQLLDAGMPLFGICLGHQILGLAGGARTTKMKFGHHGANHPVQELDSGQVFITSQNHGFAVDESTLPGSLRATHRSLFDGSLQGLRFADRPAFGFQGHPEASPGPHDVNGLFDRFVELMTAQGEADATA